MNEELSLIIKKSDGDMENIILNLDKYLKTIMVNKITPDIFNNINVLYDNKYLKIRHLANFVLKKSNTINIIPWEINKLKIIEKAISLSSLNISCENDGKCLIVRFTSLNKEHRLNLVKEINKIEYNYVIKVRNIRRQYNNIIKKYIKKNNISNYIENMCFKNIDNRSAEIIKIINITINKKKNDIKSL